ncbi:MAG: hypothetical protein IPO93_18510 [Actinobacteria bacterium]|nr:hypothetical protein [Actinomycetota bacterium]
MALPLQPGLTVLYGLNGAGKSWILDCLYSCLVGRRVRLDGSAMSPFADSVLLLEADFDRVKNLDAFLGTEKDDRFWGIGHSESVEEFKAVLLQGRQWAYAPGWRQERTWLAYLALSPDASPLTRGVFDADQELKLGVRAFLTGDHRQAHEHLDRTGLRDVLDWDEAAGVLAIADAPVDLNHGVELIRASEDGQVFASFPNQQRVDGLDNAAYDIPDGLPIPIQSSELEVEAWKYGSQFDVLIEDGEASEATALRAVGAGDYARLLGDDGWCNYSPDNVHLEDLEGLNQLEQVPLLRAFLHTRLVLGMWSKRVEAVANDILRRLLLDPPALRVTVSNDVKSVLRGDTLGLLTASGLRLEELSRAERRWSILAVKLAIKATTRNWSGEVPSVASSDVLRFEKPTFIIIDEPEAALHRAAESHMAEGLKWLAQREGAYVVVATHSPELLDSMGSAVYRVHPTDHEIFNGSTLEIVSRSQVTELTDVDRRQMHDLGLQPSDLLRRSRAFLLVEGLHDEIVLRHFVGDDLDRLRVVILPLRGAAQLPSTLDSRFLFEFTDAVLVPLLDNISAAVVTSAWNEAVTIASMKGSDAAGARIRKALPTKRDPVTRKQAPENKFLGEFLSRAIELGVQSRVAPFSLSAADIVHYLPVEAFVDKPGVTWESLWQAHREALDSGRTQHRSAKDWIAATYRTSFYRERIAEAARAVSGRPTEFQDLVVYIDLAVNKSLLME